MQTRGKGTMRSQAGIEVKSDDGQNYFVSLKGSQGNNNLIVLKATKWTMDALLPPGGIFIL